MSLDALTLARAIEAARTKRRTVFNPALFDEHAWDFLLFLFIAAEEQRAVRRSDAVDATIGSLDLLNRWLQVLESEGAIELGQDDDTVRLTADGHRNMREALNVLPTRR